MKKRTIYITLFLIFIIGVISLIGTFAIDSTITEGTSSKADYLFNITLGDRTNREIVIPGYDSKIVDIKISNPNEFNISYLLYLEGINSNISIINISDTDTSGVLNSKNTNLIKVFIQNNSSTDTTVSIKDIVGFEKETLDLPSNSTSINKDAYYKAIVKSNNNTYGKVTPNVKLTTSKGTLKYNITPNTGYEYKSNTCNGTVVNNILTISNITSNINCSVVFEPKNVTVTYNYRNNVYIQDTSAWVFGGNSQASGVNWLQLASTDAYTGVQIRLNNDVKKNTNYTISMQAYRTTDYSGNLRLFSSTMDADGNVLSYNHKISVNTSNLPLNTWKEFSYSFNSSAYTSWDWISINYDTANQGPVYVSNVRLDEYETKSVSYNANYGTMPTPTRTGYTFDGWYTGPDGTGTKVTSTTVLTNVSDHTLYANWKVNYVNIVYNYRNNVYIQDTSTWVFRGNSQASGVNWLQLASTDVYTGVSIRLNNDVKKNTNYTISMQAYRTTDYSGNLRLFSSTMDADGNVLSYNHKISVNTSNLPLNTWKEFSYSFNSSAYTSWDWISINYDTANQGPVYVSNVRLDEYETKSVSYNANYGTMPTPTRTGYTFDGWYTGPDGTGNKVTSDTIFTNISNHTLYANWTPNTYTVTFNTGNLLYNFNDIGATETDGIAYSISNGVATVTALRDDGYGYTDGRVYLEAGKTYVFSCDTNGTWGSGKNDTVEVYIMKDGEYNTFYQMGSNNNYVFTPASTGKYWLRLDVNLKGKTYTFSNISFSDYLSAQSVTFNEKYGTLPTPTRSGYTFDGWYTGANGTGTKVTSDTLVTNAGNHTLYANWK